ncbi:MAG: hypothetical protein NZ703_14925, partial [Gemmataceae bacterium]|nr:hypothetical protein [Gemmataceae bacterium]
MKANETTATFPFRDVVRAAVLQAAAMPQTLAALKKVAKAAVTKTWAKAAEAVVNEMVAAGELHAHTQGRSPRYGRDQPPLRNDPVKVRQVLLQAAEQPQTAAQLVKITVKETKADKAFVETELQRLIKEGQLHPQGPGRSPRYGLHKPTPPHPFDIPPGKTAFARLVTAARKLLHAHPTVAPDDLLHRLRCELLPGSPSSTAQVPSIDQRTPLKAETSPPPLPPTLPTLPTAPLRAYIEEAYNDLCLDPDFQDRLVEIRRLYHWLQ